MKLWRQKKESFDLVDRIYVAEVLYFCSSYDPSLPTNQ